MSILGVLLTWGIFTTVSLLIFNIYLYATENNNFSKSWVLGWFFYLVSQIAVTIITFRGNSASLELVRYITLLLNAYFFLEGGYNFTSKTIKKYWRLSVGLLIVWVIVSKLLGHSQVAQIIPVWTLSGVILIITGLTCKGPRLKEPLVGKILRYSFILWGIHRIVHAIVNLSVTLSILGYSLDVVLQYLAGAGVVLFFFRDAKESLEDSVKLQLESESRYESLFEKNNSVMSLIDPETGNVIAVNDAACRYYGYERERFQGMNIKDINLTDSKEVLKQLDMTRSGRKNVLHFKHRLASGEVRDVEVYSGPIVFEEKTLLYSIIHDITDRKKAEDRVIKLAYYDSLTGLPNNILFNDYISKAVRCAKKNNTILGVLIVDFDRFKNINNILGHSVGDAFLKTVSGRLKDLLEGNNYIARIGGDEFAILLPKLVSSHECIEIAQTIGNEFKSPTKVDSYELFSTVSIGISIYPDDGNDGEDLIRKANIAMYRAKELGRDNYKLFTKDMTDGISDAFYLVNNLGGVIERDELMLHYQPKVETNTGRIAGVEALLRWKHPVLGFISPADFIPKAEETGLVIPIGEWALRTACSQNLKWQREGLPKIMMAVNISGRQLQTPGFVEMILGVLKDTGMDPGCLELEITESIAVQNVEAVNEIISKLKAVGVSIAMDDFGTGYSDFGSLNQLNLDVLKIDQSFIKSIAKTPKGKEITEAIIAMAHALNLKVTAEGVETEEHMEFLRTQRCDFIQGYYISRPVVGDVIGKMLKMQTSLT